jgi:isopentenyl-diphosphate delta-isomerase
MKESMEEIVVLNEQGQAVAALPKETAHSLHTPLHLAFSCYAFDSEGEFLLTRRAWSKKTWPGVWTNSACGHPAPGEAIDDAVRRRLDQELGVGAVSLDLVTADFRYQARMANGIVENEICPIFRAVIDRDPAPDATEVAETMWVPWDEFVDAVMRGSMDVSPWAHLQITRLAHLGPDPRGWPEADPRALPPAAHLAAAGPGARAVTPLTKAKNA